MKRLGFGAAGGEDQGAFRLPGRPASLILLRKCGSRTTRDALYITVRGEAQARQTAHRDAAGTGYVLCEWGA